MSVTETSKYDARHLTKLPHQSSQNYISFLKCQRRELRVRKTYLPKNMQVARGSEET